ncbi:MAG: hypothetical protein WBN60_18955 [Polyangiales bacterium]
MHIKRTLSSPMRFVSRVACVGAFFATAACSDSPAGENPPVEVSIGGTVSGLDGTLVLLNNGADDLTVSAAGAFTFATRIASGTDYSVTVGTQPEGQTCEVTNGSGIATADVTNVTVECEGFVLRPLPQIYATGNAINYSPYRAQGPEEQPPEMPSDEDILEDLTLIDSAGYNLLRLFGGDPVSESILRVAQENFPEMVFQQGIFIQRVSSSNCENEVNESQIETGIRLANTYDSVVTVSVGNEPSFAGSSVACLEGYINRTRNAVAQPVTADDDYTFYAGLSNVGPPDTILPLLDFVSIHMYPITFYREWDWKQEAVEAGPLRAEAMMNAAFERTEDNYQAVYDYEYVNGAGETVTIGESLPIVIGETGWKAVPTFAPGQEIEIYAATPVNAKWYFDLLQPWEGSEGGPLTVFYFQPFDEVWKDRDDGWGLWDEDRMPRYALCDTPAAGSPCNDPVYADAGYYDPQP